MKNVVRVHILGGGPEKVVGIELVAKNLAGYQMMPVSLSADQGDVRAHK